MIVLHAYWVLHPYVVCPYCKTDQMVYFEGGDCTTECTHCKKSIHYSTNYRVPTHEEYEVNSNFEEEMLSLFSLRRVGSSQNIVLYNSGKIDIVIAMSINGEQTVVRQNINIDEEKFVQVSRVIRYILGVKSDVYLVSASFVYGKRVTLSVQYEASSAMLTRYFNIV